MAIPYAWTCHACGNGNPAGGDKCAACGCDAVASRAGLESKLATLKERNAAVALAPQATGLQLIVAIIATIVLIAGGLMVFFSDETLMGFVIAFIGYLLAKLAGRLGRRTENDAQN